MQRLFHSLQPFPRHRFRSTWPPRLRPQHRRPHQTCHRQPENQGRRGGRGGCGERDGSALEPTRWQQAASLSKSWIWPWRSQGLSKMLHEPRVLDEYCCKNNYANYSLQVICCQHFQFLPCHAKNQLVLFPIKSCSRIPKGAMYATLMQLVASLLTEIDHCGCYRNRKTELHCNLGT